MSLAKYKIFSTVVEVGSLTEAATKLNLTQSAISHAIQSLEKEWGFSLLSRGRSGIHLTSNGAHVLSFVRETLKWDEQLQQQIALLHGIEIGTVKIGTITSVSIHWIPAVMHVFNERFPHITIEVWEGNYAEIEQWLMSGAIDFGFVSLPASKLIETLAVHQDELLCIVPDSHRFASLATIEPKQLHREPFIMLRQSSDNDVYRLLREHHVEPNVRFELGDDQAVVAMVEHEHGISILPKLVLFHLPPNVRTIPLAVPVYRTLAIASPSFKTMSPAAKQFVAVLQQWLAEKATS